MDLSHRAIKDLNKAHKCLQDAVTLEYDEQLISSISLVRHNEVLKKERDLRESHLLKRLDLYISLGDTWSEDIKNAYMENVNLVNAALNTNGN